MKLVNRYFFLCCLWLVAVAAHAQAPLPACVSLNQPACSFVAIDVATNLTVESFCVGRAVRFEPCQGRTIDLTFGVRYGVRPGVDQTFGNAGCLPPNLLPYSYTPGPADIGMVTVSELTNDPSVTPPARYYIRNFRVYGTPAPAFTVAPCPTGAAQVTLTDASYSSYTVRAGTGPSLLVTPNQPLVVALNGATALTVTGRYTGPGTNSLCEGAATQTIPPVSAPQTPQFSSLTLQGPLPGGAATLAVGSLPAGYKYLLQLADGSAPGGFREVLPVPAGSTSLSLPGPAAGCYRLFRDDFCGTSPTATPLICTLSLRGASANNRNQLLFTDAGNAGATYRVSRNGTAITGLPAIAGGLEDTTVQCGATYAYVITATLPGGQTSVSNPVSVLTQSALPPARPRLIASINDNDVVVLTPLLARPFAPGSLLMYRRTAGGQPATDFGTYPSPQTLRDSVAVRDLRAAPPCYTVRLTDVCGNVSAEGPPACPAVLAAVAAGPDGALADLSWTRFSGPDPSLPVSYVLERLDRNGSVVSTAAVSGTSFSDLAPSTTQQTLRYRLKISGGGLPVGTFSYSNKATVTRALSVTIPTAFTPNGDGLNDVLEVKGKYLSDYTFVVADRNGQEVFRGTQRTETWDGRISGHAPVPGAYVWRFQQDSEDGKRFSATGSVSILK